MGVYQSNYLHKTKEMYHLVLRTYMQKESLECWDFNYRYGDIMIGLNLKQIDHRFLGVYGTTLANPSNIVVGNYDTQWKVILWEDTTMKQPRQ